MSTRVASHRIGFGFGLKAEPFHHCALSLLLKPTREGGSGRGGVLTVRRLHWWRGQWPPHALVAAPAAASPLCAAPPSTLPLTAPPAATPHSVRRHTNFHHPAAGVGAGAGEGARWVSLRRPVVHGHSPLVTALSSFRQHHSPRDTRLAAVMCLSPSSPQLSAPTPLEP